jgi:hypothetical protein
MGVRDEGAGMKRFGSFPNYVFVLDGLDLSLLYKGYQASLFRSPPSSFRPPPYQIGTAAIAL